jgi:stage V sporulation protein G
MDIKAVVFPIEGEHSLRANAQFTINDQIVVKDVKVYEAVIDGDTGEIGLKVGMPSKKIGEGKFVDVAFPTDADLRKQISDTVLTAYHDTIANGRDETKRDLEPSDLSVKVTNMRFNGREGESNYKATCQVTFGDVFVVKGVNVMDGKNGLFAQTPYQKGTDGEHYSVVRPINPEFGEMFQAAVIRKFEAEIDKNIGNTHHTAIGKKEDLRSFNLNSKFAQTLAPFLNEADIKWSGRENANDTTTITIRKKDNPVFNQAVDKAKAVIKERKGKIHDKLNDYAKQAKGEEKAAEKERKAGREER